MIRNRGGSKAGAPPKCGSFSEPRGRRRAPVSAALTSLLLLVALASLGSCASLSQGARSGGPGVTPPPSFHLLDRDADYAALGIDRHVVAPREDGRRSPADPRHFEWWYFDALLEDGTTIVAWFGDNWPFGIGARTVSLEITPAGGATERWFGSYREKGSFGTDRADVRIGPHSFSGNLVDYHIFIDPAATGGQGIDLNLHGTVAAWRPASGVIAEGDDYFAWLAAVPEGEVSGSVTVEGATRQVRGSGYHDHNWGNISPAALMDSWWWGRATVGGHTVIASELRAAQDRGGGGAPLLFVGSPAGLDKEAWSSSQVEVIEGPPMRHPDPRHPRTIASWVRYSTADGFVATFPVTDRMITSTDLLDGQSPLIVGFARAFGLKPWYSRFLSPVSLALPGKAPQVAPGTLEYFEFR